MSQLIILCKQRIELRRQYLKDIRYAVKTTPHRGKTATCLDLDDLLHFEADFVSYVKAN